MKLIDTVCALTLTLVCVDWIATGVLGIPVSQCSKDSYLRKRADLIQEETSRAVGANIVLTADEQVVNEFIMKEKRREIDNSRLNRTRYLNAASFYLSKAHIDQSPIFKVIRRMPKGGVLHVHELGMGTVRWVVKNATYWDTAYMCIDKNNYINLAVFDKVPVNTDCVWKTVKSERQAFGNEEQFDEMLIKNLTMLSSDPLVEFESVTEAWDRFTAYFAQVGGILYCAPVMRQYFYQALQDFYDDNVQYIEMRGVLDSLFLMDQTKISVESAVKLYQEVAQQFTKDHPDFSGVKLISTALRFLELDAVKASVLESIELRKKYPDFFIGFDLVGQEDPNYSLRYYLDALLYPSQQDPPADLPYFFHAAETNWQGTEADYNLADALLLNTTRIGHGFGLVKHPKLAEIVKARGVAVEIHPISNQLLGLVKDMRNHGTIPLLADDFPVVISSDDPGTWSALPLSHDFYVAFMTMCGRDGDLAVLKQLALNSITYSMMQQPEKTTAMQLWQAMWDAFIKEMANALRKGEFSNIKDSIQG